LLIAALIALLAIDAAVVAVDTRQGTFGTIYIATVGKIRMLATPRESGAAGLAGQPRAFEGCATAATSSTRDESAARRRAAAAATCRRPARPRPALDALDVEWKKSDRTPSWVIARSNLLALGLSVRQINAANPALQELADEISALSVQSGGPRGKRATAQLMMLTQRMAEERQHHARRGVIDPEVSFLLGKDTNTFRDTLKGLIDGSEAQRIARSATPSCAASWASSEARSREYQRAVSEISGNQQRLVNAKRATFDLFNDSETPAGRLRAAQRCLRGGAPGRRTNLIIPIVVSLLASACCRSASSTSTTRGAAPTRAGRSIPRTRRRFSACSTRSRRSATAT
jgi:twitching motility protein PilJ